MTGRSRELSTGSLQRSVAVRGCLSVGFLAGSTKSNLMKVALVTTEKSKHLQSHSIVYTAISEYCTCE